MTLTSAGDRIEIRRLELPTRIGVDAWERRVRQTLQVDLDLPIDATAGARDDDLAHALDYAAVAAHLRRFAADSDCLLLETFVENVAATLLDTFALPWVRVRVYKFGPIPDCGPVQLVIERHA